MNLRLSLLFSSLILMLLSSCGEVSKMLGQKPIDGDHSTMVSIVNTGTPKTYKLHDPDCREENAVADLGTRSIWTYVDGKIQLVRVDLSGFSGKGLASKFIKNSYFDSRISLGYDCEISPTSQKCRSGNGYTQGQQLNFCGANKIYPRSSVENAALSAAYGMKKAYLMQQKIDPKKVLEKITFEVFPISTIKIIQRTEDNGELIEHHETRIMTDNAYWSFNKSEDNKSGNSYIAIIPHSEERDLLFPIKLWEQPAVMSHEFGHHIFHNYAPSVAVKNSIVGLYFYDDAVNNTQRTKVFDKALSALNEGVADKWSHISFESGNDPMGQWTLRNRDVNKEDFDTGTAKKLDHYPLGVYFGAYSASSLSNDVNYTDEHMIGAITAHGITKLLSIKFKDKAQSLYSTVETYIGSEVLSWLKSMEYLITTDDGFDYYDGQTTMNVLLKPIFDKHSEPSQCSVIKQVFPLSVNYNKCR